MLTAGLNQGVDAIDGSWSDVWDGQDRPYLRSDACRIIHSIARLYRSFVKEYGLDRPGGSVQPSIDRLGQPWIKQTFYPLPDVAGEMAGAEEGGGGGDGGEDGDGDGDESGFDAAVGDNTLVDIVLEKEKEPLEKEGGEDSSENAKARGLTATMNAVDMVNPWSFATPDPSKVVDLDPRLFSRRPSAPSS